MAKKQIVIMDEVTLVKQMAKLFNRLGSDPEFARLFDRDPAAALQGLYPQLADVPKKKIDNILDSHARFMNAAVATTEAAQYGAVGGLLNLAAKAATKVAGTKAARSVATKAARAVKSAATKTTKAATKAVTKATATKAARVTATVLAQSVAAEILNRMLFAEIEEPPVE